MTQLLISVKNVAEALIALDAGVNIIDLKDPNIGALGALDLYETIRIVEAINGRKPISATIGEQHASLNAVIASIEARAVTGVDMIKIAVSSHFYSDEFLTEITKISLAGIKMIGVFFADEKVDLNLLAKLQGAGFYGAMLDTMCKQKDLLAKQTKSNLQKFVALCEKNHLVSGLAGSLKPQYIEDLAKINPTYIGFRGGACKSDIRESDICAVKVVEIKSMLHQHNKIKHKAAKSLGLALHS